MGVCASEAPAPGARRILPLPCHTLATLTFAIGQVNFFTAVALVTKPVPGRSFTDPGE
ncbi:hypothetical protein Stsp02_28990 [Streptomyces sp. NBRC 14336]|uniref:hypothetical protein n=1 Tax=Streptomyces sp. NBRC 14336 TaxID=3030992 RepID=UPI0024A2A42C|nr:hypothetical protein [Streptomyces sp. NBRC 14336]WBO82200.1 hypothetical protein SBE_006110 [Streptomyces sp. SBE_14.2]GLW47237.1 hypothetical protein Stsp02_28990 [Streptomyces sp. NBRC 14336]